jgi:phytoene dehydrogenase-like protein
MPAISALGLAAVLDEGFFLPEGGMGRIPEALADALVASGGEIHTRSPVERIIVRGGRAVGLQVIGRGMVEADVVLSSVSGMATLGCLVAPEIIPARLRRKVASAPLSHTAVSIQLGLSNRIDVPSHSNALLPMLESHHRVFAASEVDRWLNWSVPTVTVPELAPCGGSIVEMFCPRPSQSHAPTEPDERTADRAVAALARLHRLDIVVRRVRGPEHFRDQMHLFRGALYGLSPAADPRSQFPHHTRIPGLFLAGQTTYPGSGVNPAMLSGVLAAEAALGG